MRKPTPDARDGLSSIPTIDFTPWNSSVVQHAFSSPLPYLRNFDLLLQNLILPGALISINKDEELCKNCKNNRVDKDTNYTGKNVPKINKDRKKEIGGKWTSFPRGTIIYIYIYIHPEKLAGGVKEDFVNFSFSRGQCEFFKWHFTSW